MVRLLGNEDLERSSVVANCSMNRERRLTGSNGYGRELGIDVLALLKEKLAQGASFSWLDICCGTGKALLECARLVEDPRLRIIGVDLVDSLAGPPHSSVRFETTSITSWTAPHSFDLVTSVHGFHYLGDKLGVLAEAASWLTEDGLLVANLDATSMRTADDTPLGRRLTASLRANGFEFNTRQRRIACRGHRTPRLPYRYLGANDHAGPNYTGQPAVHSYYAPL